MKNFWTKLFDTFLEIFTGKPAPAVQAYEPEPSNIPDPDAEGLIPIVYPPEEVANDNS